MIGFAFRAIRKATTSSWQPKTWVDLPLSNIYVIDGDTIEADIPTKHGLQRHRIRILGYDAYETYEELGPAATRFLRNILSMEEFTLRTCWERDRFKRLLGHLVNSEGITVEKIFKEYNLSKA